MDFHTNELLKKFIDVCHKSNGKVMAGYGFRVACVLRDDYIIEWDPLANSRLKITSGPEVLYEGKLDDIREIGPSGIFEKISITTKSSSKAKDVITFKGMSLIGKFKKKTPYSPEEIYVLDIIPAIIEVER